MNPLGDWRKGRQRIQTAYGVFVQACWAQYGDEAGIEEFHQQCSVWWNNISGQNQDKFKGISDRHNANQALVTSPGLKHLSTQVRPGNLVHDKEWEADYYDLKRSSTSSSVTPAQQTQNKLKGSKLTGPGDARERWQVRLGNLVHDEEWEANY
jgi:hypothetical protein